MLEIENFFSCFYSLLLALFHFGCHAHVHNSPNICTFFLFFQFLVFKSFQHGFTLFFVEIFFVVCSLAVCWLENILRGFELHFHMQLLVLVCVLSQEETPTVVFETLWESHRKSFSVLFSTVELCCVLFCECF